MKNSILKHYRERAGIRIVEACDYLGISQKTLNKWENGGSPRYKSQLIDLLDFYHVSLAEKKEVIYYLYGGKEMCEELNNGLSLSEMLELERIVNGIGEDVKRIKAIINRDFNVKGVKKRNGTEKS